MSVLSSHQPSAAMPDWSVLLRPALGFAMSNAALLAVMLALTAL